MLNVNVLSNLIAIVVVLLVLSLIVQSVQTAIKKFLGVKSLQLEQSLVHLFYYALDKDATGFMASRLTRLPMLRAIVSLFRKQDPHKDAGEEIKTLYDAVQKEMLKAGRMTAGGEVALESVSKADLMKFIGNAPIGELFKRFSNDDEKSFAEIAAKAAGAQIELKDFYQKYRPLIEKTPLAEIADPLAQMFARVSQLFGSGVNQITLGDMAAFGGAEIKQAERLLALLPDSMQQTLSQLETNAQADAAEGLQKLLDTLVPFAEKLQKIAWLPKQLSHILIRADSWYGTIMKSFEERYVRSMKTCALVISLLTVILLNANLFDIYRQISGNDQLRNQLISAGPKISQQLDAQKDPAGQVSGAQINATVNQVLDESIKTTQENVAVYTSFGFEGPGWIAQVLKGKRPVFPSGTAETIIGWLLMTALLSVGAPFWQDVLASLFGLKNLLNKQPPPQSETK
jgi:predicted lactoylglutathione lyase